MDIQDLASFFMDKRVLKVMALITKPKVQTEAATLILQASKQLAEETGYRADFEPLQDQGNGRLLFHPFSWLEWPARIGRSIPWADSDVMAPILSKERLPPKMRPEDAAKVMAQKARPFLDSFLKLVEVSIQTGGVVVDEAKLAASNFGSLVDKCMHGSAKLLQALCCIDLDKFTRGPEKPALQSQLPVIFVLGLLAMLYSAFVFAYMPAAGLSLNSPESLLFHAFVFLTLASFAQAKAEPLVLTRAMCPRVLNGGILIDLPGVCMNKKDLVMKHVGVASHRPSNLIEHTFAVPWDVWCFVWITIVHGWATR
eukprot:symbB.v1.2.000230.t1/scaffold4.1/size633627/12